MVEAFTSLTALIKAQATLVRIVGSWNGRTSSSDILAQAMFAMYIIPEEQLAAGVGFEAELDLTRYLIRDVITVYQGDVTANAAQVVIRNVDARARAKMRSPENVVVAHHENIGSASMQNGHNLRGLFWIP